MKLLHISEAFAQAILEAAIESRGGSAAPEKLEARVERAVQICIDADRAAHKHVMDQRQGRRDPSGQ
jgi:hypothetical protein